MSGHRKWGETEKQLVSLMYALGRTPSQVHDIHRNCGFPARSEVSIANAKTQRRDVRDLVEKWQEELGIGGDLSPTHPEIREMERKVAVGEDRIRTLNAKLKDADKGAELFYELADVIRTYTPQFTPSIPGRPEVVRDDAEPVTMIALEGDLHADELVESEQVWGLESYNFDVFRIRYERWAHKLIDYLTIHRPRWKYEELDILGLGDNLHGDIHDHRYRNHFGNTMMAAIAVGDVKAEAYRMIYDATGVPINKVAVSGNHPRRTTQKDFGGPHDNFDFLVETQVATRLRDEPWYEVALPDAWTAFVEIRGKVWCLNHGDGVRGHAGFPWYGFFRKNARVQSIMARTHDRVDFFAYGHYHTPSALADASHWSWHNGAYTATDAFALEAVGGINEPLQWAFIVDDHHGMIDILPIYVRDGGKEALFQGGDYEAALGRETTLDLVRPTLGPRGQLNITGR